MSDRIGEVFKSLVGHVVETGRNANAKPFDKLVSFNWPAEDACLMQAFSEYYGKSTSAMGNELFAPLMKELLALLPDDVRQAVVEQANKNIRAHAKKVGHPPSAVRNWTAG